MKMGAVVASAALLLSVGSAFAGPVYVGKTYLSDSYGNLGGGEFLASTDQLLISPKSLGESAGFFETFCMEEFEGATPFGLAWDADLNDRTVASPTNTKYNGSEADSHGGLQDPLSNQTAWLYWQFITHQLADYRYGGTASERASDADSLQIAIWAHEAERPAPGSGKAKQYYDAANAAVAAGYTNNGVAILNLYVKFSSGAREEHQDVLVFVPLPTAGMAGLALLGGLGMIRRRRA